MHCIDDKPNGIILNHAVEGYLRFKLERVLDVDLFINRGKL